MSASVSSPEHDPSVLRGLGGAAGPGVLRRRPEAARLRLPRLLFLLVAVGLATAPSALIVQHLWLGSERAVQIFNPFWYRIPIFARLEWPSYFIAILAAFAALIGAFLLRRRDPAPWSPGPPKAERRPHGWRRAGVLRGIAGAAVLFVIVRCAVTRQLPGWDLLGALVAYAASRLLAETSPPALLRLWRRKGPRFAAILLLQVSTVAAMAGTMRPPWGWLLLPLPVGLAIALLKTRTRLPVWAWIVPLALVLRLFRLDSWLYTFIGDDYAFWDLARDIALNQSLSTIGHHLFLLEPGVYAVNPYMGSVVQAIGMELGGIDNLGWKLSGIVLSALAIPFFYSFVRTFAGRRLAAFAALFIACSEYLMSFSKIGYVNIQALFVMSLILAAAAWAVRTRRPFAFTCLGFTAALTVYAYPAALYCLPLPALMLVLFVPPTDKRTAAGWGGALAAFLMASFPMFLQPDFFLTKTAGLFVANSLLATRAARITHYVDNVLFAAFSGLWKPGPSHYVGVGYQDPISAALVAIGIAVFIRRGLRDRFALFIGGGWLLLLLGTATHGATFPPNTRMFLLLPWFAIFAATGLSWLMDQSQRAGLNARPAGLLAGAIFALMLAANLYQAYVLSPRQVTGNQNFEAQFNRVEQNMRRAGPDTRLVLLSADWTGGGGFTTLAEVYRLPAPEHVSVGKERLPPEAPALLVDRRTVVVIRNEVEQRPKAEAEALLARAGKVPCPSEDMSGEVRLVAWQSPEVPRVCR